MNINWFWVQGFEGQNGFKRIRGFKKRAKGTWCIWVFTYTTQSKSVSTCGVESLLTWMVERENLMPWLEHMKFIHIAIFPNLLLGSDVDMSEFFYALLAPRVGNTKCHWGNNKNRCYVATSMGSCESLGWKRQQYDGVQRKKGWKRKDRKKVWGIKCKSQQQLIEL